MRSYDIKTITVGQLKAARALLDMTAQQVARETKLGIATIRRAETEAGLTNLTAANLDRIVSMLEASGIVFLGPDAEGAGVRLKRKLAEPTL